MTKPFDVRDVLLVSRLQGQGTLLNLEEALTQTYSPLVAALTGWLSLQEAGISTYVCDEKEGDRELAGFAQVRIRKGSAEADVVYLAPSPSAEAEAKTLWCRLLERLCLEAGEQGIQRIFARLPEDRPGIEAFQQVGFSIYAREDIFCLEQMPPDLPRPETNALRPQQPADGWGLQELYAALAPRLVQQAEHLTAKKWEAVPGPWLRPASREGYVLEDEGKIVGYVRIRQGQTGHWLEILLHPQAYERADELIVQSLSILAEHPPRPIYCCLRRYQGGLRAPLEAQGFQPLTSQCVMIKHTTARAKKPALKLVPALEKRAEAATPMARTSCAIHDR